MLLLLRRTHILREHGRAAIETEGDVVKLVGWRYVNGVDGPLAHLRERRDCPDRKLHYDEYAALMACLLIVLWTGRKPTKGTYLTLQSRFLGWVSDEELAGHLDGPRKA